MPARLTEVDGELDDELSVSQNLFSSLLLNPELPCPKGLVNPHGNVDAKRFSVYRNNVVVGLVGALSDIFPAIKKLLGEDAFKSLAQLYVSDQPPTSPLMFEYGKSFPDFIKAFEPLKNYPYLRDVAEIERSWLDAYHAADAQPIAFDALGAFPPEELGNLVFITHPSVRLLASDYAAVSVFSANRQDQPMAGIDLAQGEHCLITRPDTEVDVRQIPSAAAAFFTALIAGKTLGEAANEAVLVDEEFDISMAISTMLEAGMFINCSVLSE